MARNFRLAKEATRAYEANAWHIWGKKAKVNFLLAVSVDAQERCLKPAAPKLNSKQAGSQPATWMAKIIVSIQL